MQCKHCKTKIKGKIKFCPECGKKIPEPPKKDLPTKRFELPNKTFIFLMTLASAFIIAELGTLHLLNQNQTPPVVTEKEIIHDTQQNIPTQTPATIKLAETSLTPALRQNKPPLLTIDNIEFETMEHDGTKYKIRSATLTINNYGIPYQSVTLQTNVLNKKGKNPLETYSYASQSIKQLEEDQTIHMKINMETPYLPNVQPQEPLTLTIQLKDQQGQTITTTQKTTNTPSGTSSTPSKSVSTNNILETQQPTTQTYTEQQPTIQPLRYTPTEQPVIQNLNFQTPTENQPSPVNPTYQENTYTQTPSYQATTSYNAPPAQPDYLSQLNQQFQRQAPFRKLPSGTSIGIQIYNNNWGADQIIAEYKLTENGFTNGQGEDAVIGVKKSFLDGILSVNDLCNYASTHGKDDTQFRLITHNNWLTLGFKYGTQSRYCPNL